jgi:ribosomal protein S4
VGSKLLQRKWDQQNRDIHIGKLREAKPSVDVREPAQFKHIKKKLKKNQLLEGTLEIILVINVPQYRALYGD